MKLSVSEKTLKLFPKNYINENCSSEWTFIEINKNKYIIQNKNKCYIVYENNNLKCENVDINQAKQFYLIKIYEEVKHTKEDLELIEKEPIDVFIKYIDLSDPFLKREGIPQIKKDENNQELKYCLRSILKNIPWIRKIYILMPNEKVKFLKEYDYIKEKIIYVKDKDILGFDSADSHAFQFSLPKMKKFNISDNFIVMDDDYFIGQKLNKSDFFYVEKGKVVPSIIANQFHYQDMNSAKKNKNYYKKKADRVKGQTSDFFMHQVFTTYIYIMETLNKSLIIPYFTHNAIPVNINDLTEIYNIINTGKYRTNTLESLNRKLESLQFQTFVMTYTFNKYKKKINSISNNYIDNNDAIKGNYNYPLFCINTGSTNYSILSFNKTRIAMEKIFPEPTKYEENFDFSFIPNLAFNIIYEMENEIIKCQDEQKILKAENQRLERQLQMKNFMKGSKPESDESIEVDNENNDFNNIIKSLINELNKNTNELDKIKKEYDKIKKKNDNIKNYNKLLQIEINNLQNEIDKNKNDNIKKEITEKEINIINQNKKEELKEDYYINIIANLKQKLNDKDNKIKNLEFEKNKLKVISNIYFIIIEIIILLLIIFYFFNKINYALIEKKYKEFRNKDNEINKEKNEKEEKNNLIEIEMENIS